MKYAFWNNKGGTGKTTLAFQTICELARQNRRLRYWLSTAAHKQTFPNSSSGACKATAETT